MSKLLTEPSADYQKVTAKNQRQWTKVIPYSSHFLLIFNSFYYTMNSNYFEATITTFYDKIKP